MPELPDVDGFRRELAPAVGHRIDEVDIADATALRDARPAELHRALVGAVVSGARRHGKWLIVPMRARGRQHRRDDPSLIFHFGMTGALVWAGEDETPRHRHDRLVLGTTGGELRYRDMRKLQGVRLAGDDGAVDDVLAETGPDATALSAEELGTRLWSRRRQLKAALMDQSVIAGLGNLLVDEILWRARIPPSRSTQELSVADQGRLHRRMATVLRHASAAGYVPDRSGWLTGQRNQQPGACPRCATQVRHSRVAGRTTVWCPACQRA